MTAMAVDPGQPVGHVVARAVAHLHADLDQLTHAPVWTMTEQESGHALVELTRLAARVAELELRVAVHADRIDVGSDIGATSTGSWWAHTSRLTRAEAHRNVKLATALDTRFERVRHGLAAGDVLTEQAQVIVRALEALPADLDAEIVTDAETTLVELAADHDAKALRILGRRILDVVAPDVAEAHEAKLLDAEERRAEQRMRFTMADDGHGSVHGRFTLPQLHAEMLKKALLALAAPKHVAAVDGTVGERLVTPERMGRAFAEYIERYPTKHTPQAGGVAATVVVTMTLEQLLGHSNAAALVDSGEVITAGTARRLACDAGIIPVVLAGASQPLDVGRQKRFHTKAQRIAMALRDGGCTAEGCDWPPGLCQAHHDPAWATGGGTNLEHGRLLCPRHHARAHDPAYQTTKLPDDTVAFHRRT